MEGAFEFVENCSKKKRFTVPKKTESASVVKHQKKLKGYKLLKKIGKESHNDEKTGRGTL